MPAPARRERIVAAALEEFAAGGYAGTSMGAIAERAGITRAVLYDHFDSKQALYLALLEERNAAFLSHVGARITGSGDAARAHARDDRHRLRLRRAGAGELAAAVRRRRLRATASRPEPAARSTPSSSAPSRRCSPPTPRRPASTRRPVEAIVEMLIAALCGAVEWRAQNPGVERDLLVDAAMELLWRGLGRGA